MKPISAKLRQELAEDQWMRKCCLCGKMPVEWHHAVIYRGRQLNDRWAIVPLCHWCHQVGKRLQEALYVALKRASEADLARLPRRDWKTIYRHLEKLYGNKT